MKSTSGAHYVALDHVRAVAALMVFSWHFTHGLTGYPSPFEGSPLWGPLVLFDEGHVGVALFMCLSGYLFAKLLDGKRVNFGYFFWNRVLRLFPLLIVMILIHALIRVVESGDIRAGYWFLLRLPRGFIFPIWPNGAWSIAVELHFYLVLPLLLFLKRQNLKWLGLILLLAVAFRAYVYFLSGEVQSLAYWTIVGRIDQFVLGIVAFSLRQYFTKRHAVVGLIAVVFLSVYYLFDLAGGFYLLDGYPSKSAIWIVLPLIEGIAFASMIAWYETSFAHHAGTVSNAISKIGEYSYSIYLLHVFVVFRAADLIHKNLIDISNFYVALLISFLMFAAMIPVGFLSMKFIEAPFLKLRRPYYVKPDKPNLMLAAATPLN